MKKLLLLVGVFMTFSFSSYSQQSPEIKIIKTGIDPTTIIDYDITMDFNIQAITAGVCFGETDPNNFFMWQVNIEGGRSYFRPHVWNGGGAALITEVDISSMIVIQPNVTYMYRIEIRGDKASTYINNILIDADRVNPRGAGVNYGYANLGIREDKAESINTLEQASYDNVKVTSIISGTLTTLFEENFSDATNFLFTTGTVVDGRLVVLGKSYSWQRDPTAITVYTIKMDVEIKAVAAGVCFGETDPGNFFMWQLNIDGGKSALRPHVWNSGGPALITELDISSLIVLQPNTIYALRIEINGDKASTYINDILVDADRINPRGGAYGYANLGFRGSHNDAGTSEEAFYDNITVTNVVNGAPSPLFSENFSNATYTFDGGSLISGRLYTTGGPDAYIWQKTPVVTAIQTIENKNVFSVYPNPVKNVLTISTSSVDYQIYNLVGKQIQTGKGTALNVADFVEGVYLVRVGNKICKFVKN